MNNRVLNFPLPLSSREAKRPFGSQNSEIKLSHMTIQAKPRLSLNGLATETIIAKPEDQYNKTFYQKPLTISEKFKLNFRHIKNSNDKIIRRLQNTERTTLTQSKSETNQVKMYLTATSTSISSSTNNFFSQLAVKKQRKRNFIVDKKSLIKESKFFYLTTCLSGTFLTKCDHYTQLKQFNNHIVVLYDNLQYFQKTFIKNRSFAKAFINMNIKLQVKVNKTIEELCAIILEFLKILLTDFYDSIEDIVYCKVPNLDYYSTENLNNEEEILNSNLKLLSEVTNYLDSCLEVTNILIEKVEFLSLSKTKMDLIKVYLDQSRFKASTLTAIAENYIEKAKEDMIMLKNFEEKALLRPKKSSKKRDQLVLNDLGRKTNMKTNIKSKMSRINNALNFSNKKIYSPDFMIQKDKVSHELNKECKSSMINSLLVSKLLKYVDKPTREKIIARRIMDRYHKNGSNYD